MASQYGLQPITTPDDTNVDIYANQTTRIVGVTVVLIVIPTTVVFLRFVARLLSKVGLWWDDWLALAALICSLVLSALQIYSLSIGFGQHMDAIPIENRINDAEYWFKLFYAYETIYDASAYLSKLSILLFYSRIFKEDRFLFWLKVVGAIATLHFISGELTVLMECVPVQALWDPTVNGTCIDIITFFIAHGAPNTAIDVAILLLPLPMIWSLDIERHHKIALSGVFLLGSFVVVASIVRVVILSQLTIVDITWEFVNAALWTAAEPAVAVTSASLPILRSLWIWNQRKRTERYGTETPDSYDEPKTGPRLAGKMGWGRKTNSIESQKYPLNDLPAGVQQVFGNRVVVATGGQSRKLSDETDMYADLPIMHPQEAAVAYGHEASNTWQPTPASFRSHQSQYSLPSNRSELYG